MAQIRILLADDHNILRDGMRLLLERQPGFLVVGEAADGRETLQLARARTVDLASVGPVGQGLPALYFPFNLEQDTVTMFLAPFRLTAELPPKEG